jgi:hypothetical protein
MPPRSRPLAAAAEAPTLLDTLARAPAAAELVVRALGRLEDRRSLRLAHSQLLDAVAEATTKIEVPARGPGDDPRPPAPRRWPRLEELTFVRPDSAAVEALGSGDSEWGSLCVLSLGVWYCVPSSPLDTRSARSLSAALRRMPALRAFNLYGTIRFSAHIFLTSSAEATPRLRALTLSGAGLTPAAARTLADGLAARGARPVVESLPGRRRRRGARRCAHLCDPSVSASLLPPDHSRLANFSERDLAARGAERLGERRQRRRCRARAHGAVAAPQTAAPGRGRVV